MVPEPAPDDRAAAARCGGAGLSVAAAAARPRLRNGDVPRPAPEGGSPGLRHGHFRRGAEVFAAAGTGSAGAVGRDADSVCRHKLRYRDRLRPDRACEGRPGAGGGGAAGAAAGRIPRGDGPGASVPLVESRRVAASSPALPARAVRGALRRRRVANGPDDGQLRDDPAAGGADPAFAEIAADAATAALGRLRCARLAEPDADRIAPRGGGVAGSLGPAGRRLAPDDPPAGRMSGGLPRGERSG